MYNVYRFHGPNCLRRTGRLVDSNFGTVGVPTRHLFLGRKEIVLGDSRVVRVFRCVRRGSVVLSVSLTSKSARMRRVGRVVRRCPRLQVTVKRFNVIAAPR